MDRVEKQPNRLASISLIGEAMLRSFLDMKEKARQGRKIVWANGLPGFLLARGADMPVLHAEGLVAGGAELSGHQLPLFAHHHHEGDVQGAGPHVKGEDVGLVCHVDAVGDGRGRGFGDGVHLLEPGPRGRFHDGAGSNRLVIGRDADDGPVHYPA